MSSVSGQKVIPSPYGRQRPEATVAYAPTSATNSDTSRVLPTPAAPITVTSWHSRRSALAVSPSLSTPSSSVRPTRGVSQRRANESAPAMTPSTRQASTGALLPFASTDVTASSRDAWRTSRSVTRPIRMSPPPAASSSRFAVLTASPVASVATSSPVTTSPVLMPMRIRSSGTFRPSREAFSRAEARSASRARPAPPAARRPRVRAGGRTPPSPRRR